jgi:MOSC domain-containing protein
MAQGVGDREWMVVDPDGRFLTQREVPRLALVATGISPQGLRLDAPHVPSLNIPFDAPSASREVVVWRSTVLGSDCGDAAANWMSEWLAREVRLVRFDRARKRECNRDYVGDSGAHTMFADGYPILVANTASLRELNDRLAARGHAALPMNRFRPNIVIEGLPAFEEDHIDTVEVDGVVLRLVKPCTRCQVTTTDQATARVGIEPLPTLGEFRMDGKLGGVTFGMNAIAVRGEGRSIAAGEPAAVEYRF